MMMTDRDIAKAIAQEKFRAYLMADFNHMMGRSEKPDPAFYGYSGGNMVSACGYDFNTSDLVEYTAPIHAGF